MAKSQRPRMQDLRVIMRLLREVCELGEDTQAWRVHMLGELAKLVGAGLCIHYLHDLPTNPARLQFRGYLDINADPLWRRYIASNDVSPDPMTAGMKKLLGRTFVRSEDQLCPGEQWYSAQIVNEVFRPIGADHELASVAVLPDGKSFSCVGFGRQLGDPPFGRRERQVVHLFHTELVELWRKPALGNGEASAVAKLSPRLRQTLQLLQEGLSEKQIGIRLKISAHTVHDYVKELHRRFEAHSSGELLARAHARPRFRPSIEFS